MEGKSCSGQSELEDDDEVLFDGVLSLELDDELEVEASLDADEPSFEPELESELESEPELDELSEPFDDLLPFPAERASLR